MRHEASRRPRVVGELARPVFFVGFMGAGKTSVARRLARTCGVASVDMDTYLERREGKRVKEIFAQAGEDGFRAIETDVLRELAGKEPLLVSCGGGVVKRDENRAILRDAGFVVYLKVTADMHNGTARVFNANGGSYVNFRSRASLSANVIGTVPVGTTVKVLEKTTDWTKVEVNGKTGYISTWFLKF